MVHRRWGGSITVQPAVGAYSKDPPMKEAGPIEHTTCRSARSRGSITLQVAVVGPLTSHGATVLGRVRRAAGGGRPAARSGRRRRRRARVPCVRSSPCSKDTGRSGYTHGGLPRTRRAPPTPFTHRPLLSL